MIDWTGQARWRKKQCRKDHRRDNRCGSQSSQCDTPKMLVTRRRQCWRSSIAVETIIGVDLCKPTLARHARQLSEARDSSVTPDATLRAYRTIYPLEAGRSAGDVRLRHEIP